MSCPIIIDGPNFINRILDYGISKRVIIKHLSLTGVRRVLKVELPSIFTKDDEDTIEFLHSSNQFGYGKNKFTVEEQKELLSRLMLEKGVHIDKIYIEGSDGKKEKGVDISCASRLWKRSFTNNILTFISEDRDFIPVLRDMREIGKKVVICSYAKNPTLEVMNEAYHYVDLRRYNSMVFTSSGDYRYKHIDDVTIDDICYFIQAMPSFGGKICVYGDGKVGYGTGFRDNQHDNDHKFSCILNHMNEGALVASDDEYLHNILTRMKEAWKGDKNIHINTKHN